MAQLAAQGPIGASGPTSQVWTTPYPHKPGERARDKSGNEYLFVQCFVAVAGSGILVSISSDNLAVPLLITSLLSGRVGVAQTTMAVGDGGWVQVYGTAFVQGGVTQGPGCLNSTDLATVVNQSGTITSVTDGDNFGLLCHPQFTVTSPTGTLGLAWAANADAVVGAVSQVSISSDAVLGCFNPINGMYLLTPAAVSNLSDAFIIAQYPLVTSAVSAVSNTSGNVSHAVAGTSHIGADYIVFLNYPYLQGLRTS